MSSPGSQGGVTTAKPDDSAAHAGLAGVVASDSSISLVDGDQGKLLYRGYDIADLAEHSTFEETAWLLWHGRLPTRPELKEFNGKLASQRRLPPPVLKFLKLLPKETASMDALRTAVSALGNMDPDSRQATDPARRAAAERLLAQFPTIVAAGWRISQGAKPVAPRRSGSTATNFLRMVFDNDPDPEDARALDIALILHADHEFNASTFSARVTASTLSDIYSTITSAIGTLKGPLHGGANLEVMQALEHIGRTSGVGSFVDGKLGAHEKIMGFGHRVYHTMDPRARVLKVLSKAAGERHRDTQWYEISAKLEETVLAKKGLYPNVDFYTASLYHVMGIPHALFPSIFAVSRISGWLAHVLEQYADNKLIRPVSNYVGPRGLSYVSIGKRR